LQALFLSCTLKKSPEPSNSESLASVLQDSFQAEGIGSETIRLVDLDIAPGVTSDEGAGDEWPRVHDALLKAEILVFVTPTWVGRPSSVAQRAIERMDAMLSETDDEERPVAYNRVAGVVVTGNEDGAHHVISEIAGALGDIGYTIPGQAWTYWNKGPGPGDEYPDTDEGHEWSKTTGQAAAQNLIAVARALENGAMTAPPS
jgi:multimeric flavodoxin WrbA